MPKENRVRNINESTGICWGLICLIPFGWIAFLASIFRRKNDVIKYGTLETGLALKVLHNYIVSFTVVTVVIMIACVASWRNGVFGIPNVIAIIVVTIAYNVVVEKILDFEEEKQRKARGDTAKTKDDGVSGKSETKTRERSRDDYDDTLRTQLKELKDQNRRQADTIEKLEKEIKKREK